MKKKDIIENVKVEKLIFGGKGLAFAPDGKKIIISGGVIPGSTINLRILKNRKNYYEGQMLDEVSKSPLEEKLPSHFQVYGGCKWLPISYDNQLKIKEEQIKEAFNHLKDYVEEAEFHSIIASPEKYGYRNKVEFSFGKYISAREEIHDDFRFGFHKQGEFDRIIDCSFCVLADDEINEIFKEVDNFSRKSGLPTYDPKTQIGFWRHFVVRKTRFTNEIMLIFSVNDNYLGENNKKNNSIRHSHESGNPDNSIRHSEFISESILDPETSSGGRETSSPGRETNSPGCENSFLGQNFNNFISYLTSKFPNIKSVYYLKNNGKADIVTGEFELIYGVKTIRENLLDKTFEINPKSFFQTNSLGAEKLYGVAIDMAFKGKDKSKKGNTMLDLYAGTGTLGILFSLFFEKVYSVELVKEASEDGERNAKLNGINNIEFVNAKVEEFLKDLKNETGLEMRPVSKVDLLVIDPPRDGMHPDTLPNIIEFSAEVMVYVSCNPSTLARDLDYIVKNSNYKITDITPVDMFPHTHHIETVVRLEKKIK